MLFASWSHPNKVGHILQHNTERYMIFIKISRILQNFTARKYFTDVSLLSRGINNIYTPN